MFVFKKKTIDMLNQYNPIEKKECHDLKRIIKFIENNNNWWDRDNPKGHVTGSAWIINKSKTDCLLLFHQKYKRWLQLGGHIERLDSSILATALREAKEESGTKTMSILSQKIFDVDIHSIQNKNKQIHLHFDIRFLLGTHQKIAHSDHTQTIQWFPLKSLNHITQNNSILRMAKKTITP